MWPTTLATTDTRGGAYPRDNPTLKGAMRRWPTACVTDSKDSARHTTTTGIMAPGTSLTDAMRGHLRPTTPPDGKDTTVLVPEFVEALMGLPEGWTLVDAEPVSLGSETPSSGSKPRRRSRSS